MQRSQTRIDLHVHSTASDGVLSPSEVVCLALEQRVDVLALTDHDTVSGIAEALDAAAGTALEVIPGVEINSEGDWGDLHFLGYYVDCTNGALQERLQAVRDARLGRAYAMVKRLGELGLPVEWERVRALASGESVGRPHVARALLERGHVQTLQEAFDRYIGNDGPAYVPRLRLSPPEVIGAIRDAGGVPVLAHPAYSGADIVARIPEFVAHGLRGLEVYYPAHTPEQVELLLRLCWQFGLLATGGSDFHGPGHGEGAFLGSADVPSECLDDLRAACCTR